MSRLCPVPGRVLISSKAIEIINVSSIQRVTASIAQASLCCFCDKKDVKWHSFHPPHGGRGGGAVKLSYGGEGGTGLRAVRKKRAARSGFCCAYRQKKVILHLCKWVQSTQTHTHTTPYACTCLVCVCVCVCSHEGVLTGCTCIWLQGVIAWSSPSRFDLTILSASFINHWNSTSASSSV